MRNHRSTTLVILLALIAALTLLGGCGGGKAVTRVDTDTTIDLYKRPGT